MAYVRSHTSCQLKGGRCDKCNRPLLIGERVGIVYSQDDSCLGMWCAACEEKLGDDSTDTDTPTFSA